MPFLGHPLRLFIGAAQTLALGHVITQYGYSWGPGSGASMVPTFLVVDEWMVVDKTFRRGRGVRVGDCVDFVIPVEPREEGVKRVVGMPGDYVVKDTPGKTDVMLQVPKGHCYIVGDNLPWSRDSRDYGPVPLGLIKGKVIAKTSMNGWNPINWFTRVNNGLTPVGSST